MKALGGVLGVVFCLSASAQTTGTSVVQSNPLKNVQASYWSMIGGPAPGQGFSETKLADGSTDTAFWFHLLFLNYEVNPDLVVGTQNRVSTEFLKEQTTVLSPRLHVHFKNVINNDAISLGLQPMIEIPTTSTQRNRDERLGILFAQNLTFKTPKRWTVLLTTMVNGRFFGNDQGKITSEFIAIPTLGYELSKTFQLMAWGWIDAAHRGGQGGVMSLQDWNDNYVRYGMNIFLRDNIQIFPCLQTFLSSPKLATSSIGLELAAQF